MNPKTFSIIIPVWQEQETINSYLHHLHHLLENTPSEDAEILVVDGDESGSTIQEISHPEAITLTAPKGRASQMNEGAKRARGEILLFLHADTHLPEGALSLIREALSDPRYMAGAFDLGTLSPRLALKIVAFMASLRSRLSRIPYGDQGHFIRREYFLELGGYASIPLMEDIELMKRIRRRGDLIVILKEKVLTSPRRWEKDGIVYGTLRNWILAFLYFLGVSPEKLARFYRFPKK